MIHRIVVSLEPDTADFLELARQDPSPQALSRFINSMLRQERFREGYPNPLQTYPSDHPHRKPEEDIMLWRSGLLPIHRKS